MTFQLEISIKFSCGYFWYSFASYRCYLGSLTDLKGTNLGSTIGEELKDHPIYLKQGNKRRKIWSSLHIRCSIHFQSSRTRWTNASQSQEKICPETFHLLKIQYVKNWLFYISKTSVAKKNHSVFQYTGDPLFCNIACKYVRDQWGEECKWYLTIKTTSRKRCWLAKTCIGYYGICKCKLAVEKPKRNHTTVVVLFLFTPT